ncbi:MAG: VIT1/CCC1 transporter family protein [Saprospiraceae bacterium]
MKRYRDAIQTEIDTAYLYERIADMQDDDQLTSYYNQMAAIEKLHRDKMLESILIKSPRFVLPSVSARAKTIAWLGRRFGQNIIASALMDTEKAIAKATVVNKEKDGLPIEGNESRHVEILNSLTKMSGTNLGRIEHHHKSIGGNALRAAVLGANDGLVSNLSLVMGVAGALADSDAVLIAGSAGLLAGAISMSLGEWISVKSSQELYERQIDLEEAEIELNPEEEQKELELLYLSKGLDAQAAKDLAEKIIADPEQASNILVKEELNIDIDELEGSAWEAAYTSFFLFVGGAIIPLFPFFFTTGNQAILYSVIASTIGLFVIGAGITLITGKSLWYSGMRQVIFGLLAAAVTYGIGRWIGVSMMG